MEQTLSIVVIGAGLMGHGIAQVFAQAGHRVALTDPNREVLAAAHEHIARNLEEMRIPSEPALRNIRAVELLAEALPAADLVIESAPEKVELKQQIFAEVVKAAPRQAILASNTSVIPITRIGERLDLDARGRLVGTHWWNPPHLVPLVEIVRTVDSRDDVVDRTADILRSVGKRPVVVQRDITGFIGNRLLHALWREAFALVEAGVCDAETIDTVVKNSFGMRLSVLGPMENADLVGLELTRNVHRLLFPELSDAKVPSQLLDQQLSEGHVGMKSGEGVRHWAAGEAESVRKRLSEHLIKATRAGV